MGNCAVCERIPFHSLPPEEEHALPHQPSVAALEESAKSCILCNLILWAAGCSMASVGGMVAWLPNVKYPSGREIMTRSKESNYNDLFMRALDNGASLLDDSGPKPDFHEIVSVDPRSRFQGDTNVRPWLFGNWYVSPFKDAGSQLVGLGVRLGTGPSIEDTVGNSSEEIYVNGTYLRIRTDDDSDMARLIPGRLRTDDQGSPIAFERVKNWSEDCDKYHGCARNHSCLKNDSSPPLPTRVLDVSGSDDIISLVETKGSRGDYLALSHCWGLSHRITTTLETYAKHQEGIPLSQLPATFRQAAEIARKLDVPYLWIDSLCIIQDDESDWEMEASRMGSVYADAYLTVSALGSADDSSGCFSQGTGKIAVTVERPHISCDTLSTGRPCIPLAAPLIAGFNGESVICREFGPYGIIGGRKDRIYVTREWMPSSLKQHPKGYLVGQFGGVVDPFKYEPLSKRGWTLQERLLSPRTLHYGTEEMYWECQHYVLAEDGALLRRDFPTMSKVIATRKSSEGALESEPRDQGTKKWPDTWLQVVEEYTARSLTRDQDKLPALSGVASSVAAETGDAYVAGLWRRDIVQGLLWSVKTFEPTHHCDNAEHDASMPPATKSTVRYPARYRAPSWSWASLDGHITHSRLEDSRIQTSCLDVRVDIAGMDKFGRVKAGWILLKGPLYLLHGAESDERQKRIYPFTASVEVLRNGSEVVGHGSVNFDSEPHFPSFAILLDDEKALVLKAKGPDAFLRIGTGHLRLRTDSHNASPEAVVNRALKPFPVYSQGEIEAELANGQQQTITIY